jgi:hypothetical protein
MVVLLFQCLLQCIATFDDCALVAIQHRQQKQRANISSAHSIRKVLSKSRVTLQEVKR